MVADHRPAALFGQHFGVARRGPDAFQMTGASPDRTVPNRERRRQPNREASPHADAGHNYEYGFVRRYTSPHRPNENLGPAKLCNYVARLPSRSLASVRPAAASLSEKADHDGAGELEGVRFGLRSTAYISLPSPGVI
jgi:hypothetical protein